MDTSVRSLVAFACGMLLASCVHAIEVSFDSYVGDVVEGFRFRAKLRFAPDKQLCDGSANLGVGREGLVFTARLAQGAGPRCQKELTWGFDPLEAGVYTFRFILQGADGAVIDEGQGVVAVQPLEGRCERDPTTVPSIAGYLQKDHEARITALMSDQRLAELAGGPVAAWRFPDKGHLAIAPPPLRDAAPIMRYLDEEYAWDDGFFGQGLGIVARMHRACQANAADAHATMHEFVSGDTGGFFYTRDAGEIAAIEAGTVGRWTGTGQSFGVVSEPACPFEHGQGVVYRFWGAPGTGPRAHFFTRDRSECYAVDRSRMWVFEGVAFWTEAMQADGQCTSGPDGNPRVPLYRLWRPFGESVHRLTTDPAIVEEMKAQGWIDEGARMCVQPPQPT